MNPLFNKLTPEHKAAYDAFFKMTDRNSIRSNMRQLDRITDLAWKVEHVLERANPVWDTYEEKWGNREDAVRARQWHADQLSRVKERLALAIQCKKEYYESTFFGKITKLVLRILCLWNRGNTSCIRRAEDFQLYFDSRFPVYNQSNLYNRRYFWAFVPVSWLNENLDMRNFYNYTPPSRAIEVLGARNDELPRFMVAVS